MIVFFNCLTSYETHAAPNTCKFIFSASNHITYELKGIINNWKIFYSLNKQERDDDARRRWHIFSHIAQQLEGKPLTLLKIVAWTQLGKLYNDSCTTEQRESVHLVSYILFRFLFSWLLGSNETWINLF